MPLIRPRLSDYYDLGIAQAECDFAIPFLDEDLPLHVDPFLLWRSPSLQDQALHTAMVAATDSLIRRFRTGQQAEMAALLAVLSECAEAGLGMSANRSGRRISIAQAHDVLSTLAAIPQIRDHGIGHIEVIQLVVDGIGKDRISDLTCSLLKSFLIDFTVEQAKKYGIPTESVLVTDIYNHQTGALGNEHVALPVSPETRRAVLLVPKRWLRYAPWIAVDSFFDGGYVQGEGVPTDRAAILLYNRSHYGLVESFIAQREAAAASCDADSVFKPLSVHSARRRFGALGKLPSGTLGGADKKYEELAASLLASVLYPYLDFAAEQVRTDSGAQIRDVIFYNTRTWDFLEDLREQYDSRQLVFELKNVAAIERDHINQLNRYMSDQFGRFGVLVTRHSPSPAMVKNLVDLWAGQRRCILVVTDQDLASMVTVYETKQRQPIEVLKKVYLDFVRRLPS
jgi:hypothetical protein